MLLAGKGGDWDRVVTKEEEEAKLKHIDEMSETGGRKVEPASFYKDDFESYLHSISGELNWESAFADEF